MYYTGFVCSCCGDVDIHPDFDMEMSEDKMIHSECYQCMADFYSGLHEAHVLQRDCPWIFDNSIPF